MQHTSPPSCMCLCILYRAVKAVQLSATMQHSMLILCLHHVARGPTCSCRMRLLNVIIPVVA